MKVLWWLVSLLLVAAPAFAQDVVDLPTRPGVQVRLLVVRSASSPSSVAVLLTGGTGHVGIYPNGSVERGGNFLVRSRQLFANGGQVAVVMDSPSDQPELRGTFRDGPEHAADLGAVVAWAHRTFGKPVWLVGTSRGTHSAAAGAVQLRGEQAPDGIVLTSTILIANPPRNPNARPVQLWPLEQLHMPVLVQHHEQDGCQFTPPQRLPELMARLPAATSKLITYTGGASRGPECEAFAHHGFNGIEPQVVGDMSAWMRAHP